VTNYLAGAQKAMTNLDLEVDETYRRYGTNLFPEAKTPAEAKAKIRESAIREHALLEARRAAGEFAEKLDVMEPKAAGNLDELAKTNGLAARATAPFSREEGPAELKVGEKFSQAAFKLTQVEPFAGPIMADDGVYVVALKQQIPSEVPPLASIGAKVTEDYRMLQAMQLAHQAAAKFSTTLTNGLAQGKAFDAICADAGIKPERLPAFALSTETLPEKTEDQVPLPTLKELAFTTPVGKSSEPERSRDGVFILYVEKKLPVDKAKLKTELPAFLATVRQNRENEVINGWLSREFGRDPKLVEQMQKLNQSAQERAARARAQ
jgi:parvulin-like peptidyl-prolyl isomerase